MCVYLSLVCVSLSLVCVSLSLLCVSVSVYLPHSLPHSLSRHAGAEYGAPALQRLFQVLRSHSVTLSPAHPLAPSHLLHSLTHSPLSHPHSRASLTRPSHTLTPSHLLHTLTPSSPHTLTPALLHPLPSPPSPLHPFHPSSPHPLIPSSPHPSFQVLRSHYGHVTKLKPYRLDGRTLLQIQISSDDVFYSWRLHMLRGAAPLFRGMVVTFSDTPLPALDSVSRDRGDGTSTSTPFLDHFSPISHAVPPLHTRHTTCSTECACSLFDAYRCLPDGLSDPRLS